MTSQENTLKITWLDECSKCNFSEYANVHTKHGTDKLLYEGDHAFCPNCDNEGAIEVDMGCAYVSWEYEE